MAPVELAPDLNQLAGGNGNNNGQGLAMDGDGLNMNQGATPYQ